MTATDTEVALAECGHRTALGNEREAVDAVDLRILAKGRRRKGKAEVRPAPGPQRLGVREPGHEFRDLRRIASLEFHGSAPFQESLSAGGCMYSPKFATKSSRFFTSILRYWATKYSIVSP